MCCVKNRVADEMSQIMCFSRKRPWLNGRMRIFFKNLQKKVNIYLAEQTLISNKN